MTEKVCRACFLGGDERQMYAAKRLAETIEVVTVGECYKNINLSSVRRLTSAEKAIYSADAVILPLPAALCEEVLPAESIIDYIKGAKNRVLMAGGRFSPYLRGRLEECDIYYFDYYENETFALKNAYITAEGAIQLAMTALNGGIRFSRCAVIGYGRIGRALADFLHLLCAEVTVWARREDVLAEASERGLKTEKINELSDSFLSLSRGFDVIFNTVPERIISNDVLLSLSNDTVMIELASSPGGFDHDIAVQYGIRFIDGRGLPGKYAPKAAGNAVADVLLKWLETEGML